MKKNGDRLSSLQLIKTKPIMFSPFIFIGIILKLAKMENFKKITGFEDYLINENGDIFSLKTNKFLKGGLTSGYRGICLYKENKPNQLHVHRLVGLEFIPNPENKPQIDHINGVLTDNRVCNLRWVTPKENSNNPITVQKLKDAISYRTVKLEQYNLYGDLIKSYSSFVEAKKEGFLYKGICQNLNGKTNNYKGYLWKRL